MKKIMFISFISISMLLVFVGLNSKSNYLMEDNILGIYLDNKLQESIPKKGEAVFSKAVCDNNATNIYWDIDKWGLFISNLSKKTKCNLYFVNYSGQTIFDFDYTGSEQIFTAPVSGTYRLETWGAQGGKINGRTAGTGGYSSGIIKFKLNQLIYINVGGHGDEGENYIKNENTITKPGKGGYNGGGSGQSGGYYSPGKYTCAAGSGGGISGFTATNKSLGHAGGYSAFSNLGNKVNQSYGFTFGLGETIETAAKTEGCGGGGGGFYGGICDDSKFGTGGSGYIGNPLLNKKVMHCYSCEESSEESTKTISTTCSEETPTSNCAKKGNGYARITLVSID